MIGCCTGSRVFPQSPLSSMIKILHVLFWYVAAHLLLFGVLFVVARMIRKSRQQQNLLIG
jgi:hypothetical protein